MHSKAIKFINIKQFLTARFGSLSEKYRCSRISGRIIASMSKQGARKDGRGNEPVGSCAMCDARSTGPRALEGKNR